MILNLNQNNKLYYDNQAAHDYIIIGYNSDNKLPT